MASSWTPLINVASILFGLASAVWFYASTVKITREKVVAQRVKEAERKGEKPNLAGNVRWMGHVWHFCGPVKVERVGCGFGGEPNALQAVGQAIASV